MYDALKTETIYQTSSMTIPESLAALNRSCLQKLNCDSESVAQQ